MVPSSALALPGPHPFQTPTPTPTPAGTPTSPPPPTVLEPTPGTAGTPAFVKSVPAPITSPQVAGSWEILPYTAPGLAVHATLLNDGRVLLVEGSGNNGAQFAAGTFNVWVWDPTAASFSLVPQLPFDLFCGGHAVLRDGKVLFLGGTAAYPDETHYFYGTKVSYVFDPATNSFTRAQDMARARWYPSALERGDGKILAVSGANDANGTVYNAEQFDDATSTWSLFSGYSLFPLYPSITQLANGQVFFAGVGSNNSSIHAPGVWTPENNAFVKAPALQHPDQRDQAAAILLPPAQKQQVAVFGGGQVGGSKAAVADTDIFDLSNPAAPTHRIGVPMATGKMHVLGVVLPDETVFEAGGSQGFAVKPVQEAAIYNPAAGSWAQMNPGSVPRTYHSEAFLLPDGRVATVGSNPTGYAPEKRIEIFSPPYLFKGERPAITWAPTETPYGSTVPVHITLAQRASTSKVVLVKPGSVTHSVDPNQRLVEAAFTADTAGELRVTIPANPNLVPPGWYMLFVVDNLGRPSVARMVHVS